ncbi:MAG: hypothetical protein O2968_21595 [Acidobacteria bacterium]|nr:hypothetical protein [Acidobacteriota bacterium]
MKIMILATVVLLLVGCDTTLTGYDYAITAVYRAPKSGLVMEVETSGHVPAGADTTDTGQGEVRIRSVAGTARPIVLTFQEDPEMTYRIGLGSTQVGNWGFREREKTIISNLARAGYPTPDAAEIAELVGAINGALGGPKSVKLKGQSTAVEVLSTRIE